MYKYSADFVPPHRYGVGPSCVVLPPEDWQTILSFLVQRFPSISSLVWESRIEKGEIIDETGKQIDKNRPYQAYLKIYYFRTVPNEPRIPYEAEIIYQDDHLLVADKPHFLPVTPSGKYLQETLLIRLKRLLNIDDLVPLHRLDRDTAGLVLFCKTKEKRNAYQKLFRSHQIHKMYEAIAPWKKLLIWPQTVRSRIIEAGHFMLQKQVPGKINAITTIDTLEINGSWARYQLKPETGQRHQLRVQMMGLGLPIAGDGLYPILTPEGHSRPELPLQLLAKELSFKDPISGQHHLFISRRNLLSLEALKTALF